MKVYDVVAKFSAVFLDDATNIPLFFMIIGGKGGTMLGLCCLGVMESGRFSKLCLY
jgi:hypothetical protein